MIYQVELNNLGNHGITNDEGFLAIGKKIGDVGVLK